MRMSSGPSSGEREAARGFVELHGGDAQIENHAIELPHAAGREQLGHVAEASLEHGEVRTSGGQLTTARHRCRIAVDREHLLRARLQDRPAVAAGAERGVKIDAADAYGERREHLAQQYRHVPAVPGARYG